MSVSDRVISVSDCVISVSDCVISMPDCVICVCQIRSQAAELCLDHSGQEKKAVLSPCTGLGFSQVNTAMLPDVTGMGFSQVNTAARQGWGSSGK